jgi:hypothetical protein
LSGYRLPPIRRPPPRLPQGHSGEAVVRLQLKI